MKAGVCVCVCVSCQRKQLIHLLVLTLSPFSILPLSLNNLGICCGVVRLQTLSFPSVCFPCSHLIVKSTTHRQETSNNQVNTVYLQSNSITEALLRTCGFSLSIFTRNRKIKTWTSKRTRMGKAQGQKKTPQPLDKPYTETGFPEKDIVSM